MKQLIGVDLGGTRLRAVRIDTAGRVFQHLSVETAATAGPETVVAQITALVEQIMTGVKRDDVLGIGVGSAGALDPFKGVVLQAANLTGWVNVPIQAMLQERIGMPVAITNDGNAAALGEWRFGNGRGCQDFIFVGLGTGIGGGVIANGQLLVGRNGLASEFGHMQIDPAGPLCNCGQTGCWEALASGTALARFAAQALQTETPSALHAIMKQRPITAADVFTAAIQGDALAQTLVRREGELVGLGLVNLLHLFSPERMTVGGGVGRGMHLLEPHITRTIATRALFPFHDVPIQYAHHGDTAGVMGAATLFMPSKHA